ncbi:hypothetical protein [Streptomyces sp. ISL-100]|uniref:hypothetical protein n=1 Tax=Streptomyces sp. ISL-100 TaxID=2819173 RepID=UPI001BEC0C25|nr:hypothetical protein [Streptomyces sp. ISL-100]MBT2400499.1 hypothetical protein [Streptomyces sp. ISL-100]
MRFRHTVAAAVGALTLVLTMPTPAGAAVGAFTYQYDDMSGERITAELIDPPSGPCITLPEVADDFVPPAHTPRNATDRPATVYAGADCTGPEFNLRAHTGYGSERLKVRSVIFH